MDETLAVVAVDLGGRPALVYKDLVKTRLVGDLQTELVEDFFGGFVNHAGANLHAKVLYGRSNHHKIEAIFKCFARAMRYACSKDARLKTQLPSTKGLAVISVFDYGAGNLRSVQNTLGAIGAEYELIRDAAGIRRATKLILPGVGHFGQMMRALDDLQVRDALIERIRAGVPFLGICLGLQALFESSEEAPDERGLGIYPGEVKRFRGDLRIPHMGWNQVQPCRPNTLLARCSVLVFRAQLLLSRGSRNGCRVRLHGALHRRPRTMRTSAACSFIPKNRDPRDSQIVKNFVEC